VHRRDISRVTPVCPPDGYNGGALYRFIWLLHQHDQTSPGELAGGRLR
jgi:hypothetical protein